RPARYALRRRLRGDRSRAHSEKLDRVSIGRAAAKAPRSRFSLRSRTIHYRDRAAPAPQAATLTLESLDMAFAESGETRIAYTIEGSGEPTVLMVMGLGAR